MGGTIPKVVDLDWKKEASWVPSSMSVCSLTVDAVWPGTSCYSHDTMDCTLQPQASVIPFFLKLLLWSILPQQWEKQLKSHRSANAFPCSGVCVDPQHIFGARSSFSSVDLIDRDIRLLDASTSDGRKPELEIACIWGCFVAGTKYDWDLVSFFGMFMPVF